MFRSERPSSARMNHGLESRIPFGITPGVGLQIVMRLPCAKPDKVRMGLVSGNRRHPSTARSNQAMSEKTLNLPAFIPASIEVDGRAIAIGKATLAQVAAAARAADADGRTRLDGLLALGRKIGATDDSTVEELLNERVVEQLLTMILSGKHH